jgi:hypothetical protein
VSEKRLDVVDARSGAPVLVLLHLSPSGESSTVDEELFPTVTPVLLFILPTLMLLSKITFT